MSTLDPQIARLTLLLGDAGDRPSPEPTEAEIVQVIDHLGAQGLPALVIGRRKILLPVDLADAWIRDKFLIASGRTMARLAARVGGAAQ